MRRISGCTSSGSAGPSGFFRPGYVAPLQPVLGIGKRVFVGDDRLGVALQPHPKARFVHHGEHRAHALVQLAHQVARGTVIIHDAGRIAVDAHLLFNIADADAIARAQAAILVDKEFRHDEQRDALGPRAPARCLGQHQMDDVLGHVVFACRDENLLPG